MRRRIAITILLTVAATIIAAGSAVYLIARAVLLADLDMSLLARAAALPELVDETGRHSEADHPLRPSDRYIIKKANGHTVSRAHNQNTRAAVELVSATFADLPGGQRIRTVVLRAFASRPATEDPPVPVTVVFSSSAEEYYALLGRLWWVVVGSGAASCTIAGVGAWYIAGAALRPLTTTAMAIQAIDEESLDRRIEVSQLPPELRPVAETLNAMLATLQDAFDRRKRFLADAAHELRTPVAALLTSLEVALRRPRAADAYKASLEESLVDARYLRRLVDALLQHARGEVLADAYPVERFDVSTCVDECMAVVKPLAAEKDVTLQRIGNSEIALSNAPARLRSVMTNLLSNAVEYTHRGGTVMVTISPTQGGARIDVTDDGTGIPAEHLPHIFEPFYRADHAHNGREHLGLGLFLVRSHVRIMGGECTVSSTPGVGTTFSVTISELGAGTTASAQPPPTAASGRHGASHGLLTAILVQCVALSGLI